MTLHEQEVWLASNQEEAKAKIEHSLAQADRGELIEGEEAFELVREERARRTAGTTNTES